jgi:hypothetical protein
MDMQLNRFLKCLSDIYYYTKAAIHTGDIASDIKTFHIMSPIT